MSSEYVPVALRQIVFDRAGGICEYCHSQAKYAVDPFVIDHIQPVSRNGNMRRVLTIKNEHPPSIKLSTF